MKEIRTLNVDGRHIAVKGIARWFRYDHLAEGPIANTSKIFFDTAEKLLIALDDGPMLTKSLNSLWDAKNAAVCQVIEDMEGWTSPSGK